MPSISPRFRPASDIASSAALLIRSSEDEPSCLPNAVRPTPVMKLMACYFQLYAIPGRDAVASPESITTTGSMDSGPAPRGASTMCNCTSGNDASVLIRLALPRCQQVARMSACDITYPRFASQRAGQHAIRSADADGHPHPRQYPALGFRVAGLPDLARLAIAAAENAADLADADRAAGVFSDGPVAAGHGARQWDRAASRVAGGGAVVCLAGAFPQAKTARGGQKKRHRDPSGQRHPAGSKHHGVRAAIRRRGGDGHETRTHAAVAIIGHAVSGASAGYFSGRAVALVRRYRNFDTGGNSDARMTDGA